MSLFVKVATNFYTHRKTARLRSVIGNDAYWIPPRLWAYAAQNQPDGDFSGYSDGELKELLGYPGDAPSMLQALLQAGFIDPDMHIHDWAQHNGYHASYADKARKAATARWEKERSKEREDTEKRGEERRQALLQASPSIAPSIAPSIPPTASTRFKPPTLEEVTFHAAKIGLPEFEAQKFWNYYGSNGWKVGKNPMKSWVSAIGGWKVRWETDRNGTNHPHQTSIAEKEIAASYARVKRMFPDNENP